MNRFMLRESVTFAILLGGLALAVAHCAACFPADKQVEAAAGYTAQQNRCIDQYSDKASIDACRDKVKAAWAASDAGGDQ